MLLGTILRLDREGQFFPAPECIGRFQAVIHLKSPLFLLIIPLFLLIAGYYFPRDIIESVRKTPADRGLSTEGTSLSVKSIPQLMVTQVSHAGEEPDQKEPDQKEPEQEEPEQKGPEQEEPDQ